MADVIIPVILVNELFDSDDDEDLEMQVIPFLATHILRKRLAAPKVLGFTDLILKKYSPTDFKHDFRLRRETFESILGDIGPFLAYQNRPTGKRPLPPEKQLLIFMWYMANQDSMRARDRSVVWGNDAHGAHMRQARIRDNLSASNEEINIVWPDENTQADNGDNAYVNRKGYPSVQLQLIVNDQMCIIDAYVGWPGSVHDARVYRNSPIYSDMKHARVHLGGDRFIIGDAAYPLSSFIMTPFRQTGHLTAAQKLYNQKVSSIRQVVERTIGHLKMRFRRLRYLYCVDIKDCRHLIMSACVLQNLCVMPGDDLTDYLDDDGAIARVNNFPPVYRDGASGILKRNQLVQFLQTIRG